MGTSVLLSAWRCCCCWRCVATVPRDVTAADLARLLLDDSTAELAAGLVDWSTRPRDAALPGPANSQTAGMKSRPRDAVLECLGLGHNVSFYKLIFNDRSSLKLVSVIGQV